MATPPQVTKVYTENDFNRWSPLLYVVALIVSFLRKFSLYERIKDRCFDKGKSPAWFLEAYLVLFWSLTSMFYVLWSTAFPNWIVIGSCLVIVAQVVQANLYHELFRPNRLMREAEDSENRTEEEKAKLKDEVLKVAHSRLRSLFLAICSYNYVTFLFGVIYSTLSSGFQAPDGEEVEPATLYDMVFFSYTVAWSVGSRSIDAAFLSWPIKITIVLQIVTTLFLVGIIVAIAVSAIRVVGEKARTQS